MKLMAVSGLSLAIAVSGFLLSHRPVSAVEAPFPAPKIKGNITKIDERDRERCERVRRECRERHRDQEREYRECVERDHCEP